MYTLKYYLLKIFGSFDKKVIEYYIYHLLEYHYLKKCLT
jgi:hypothetical protein